MNLSDKTSRIMRDFNIWPDKKLGQNFLISDKAIDEIVQGSEITKDDLVIEIGPGLGVLTNELCQKAGMVIAIELDQRFINILNTVLRDYSNFKIIQGDVLKLDLHEIIKPYMDTYKHIKVIANLPYYITTPIIMKLLEDELPLDSIVVMVQKEVADRLTAKPVGKEYGAITVSVNYYGKVSIVTQVKAECFLPSPQVDSSVIKIELYKEPIIKLTDKNLFFKVIKLAFLQRRKTILNSLSNSGLLNMSKEEMKKMFDDLGIDVMRRPETLSINDYANISEYIAKR